MKNILFLLFCLPSFTVFGQHKIELGKAKLFVPNRKFHISRIVDARLDTTLVGIARIGDTNKKQKIVLAGPAGKTILDWLGEAIPGTAETRPVLMKINRIGLGENSDISNEGATVSSEFEFFCRENDNWYFLGTSRFRKVESLGNVTLFHASNLRAALQSAVSFLNDSVDWTKIPSPEKSVPVSKVYSKIEIPVLKDTVYVEGGYRNFHEFRENKPSLKIQILKDEFGSHVYLMNSKGKYKKLKPGDMIWGFAYDNVLFINQFGWFFPLIKQAGFFAFDGFDGELQRQKNANTVAFGAILGGALGAAIATGIAATSEKGKSRFRIDWESGSFYEM